MVAIPRDRCKTENRPLLIVILTMISSRKTYIFSRFTVKLNVKINYMQSINHSQNKFY